MPWHSGAAARKAVYGDRARLRSGVERAAMRKRAEIVKRRSRTFRIVADHNIGLLMSHLFGVGTPREAWARGWGAFVIFLFGNDALCLLIVAPNPRTIAIIAIAAPDPPRN